ncbi:MAG: hypothetical protein ABH824_05330 [Nanoarchaeota archaeon]|nr:hypothetical protein [Nanoarchaeota archaeon]MBU1632732.1 hypothetical protein [Nanoarchaeota archaeon]MBU1875972.1 hypothetical protein [Nanoarchaeota archaeon]
MYQKKGQITVFIILGLIMLLSLVLILFIRSETIKIRGEVPESVITHEIATDPIKSYLENCVEDISKEAIYQASFYGGYLYPSGSEEYNEPGSGDEWYDYYFYDDLKIPFLLNEKTIHLRPKKKNAEVISNFVLEKAQSCFENLTVFEEQGFIFTFPQLKKSAFTIIKDDEVLVNLHYPLRITRDDKMTLFEDYNVVLNLRLGLLYNIAEKILNDIKENQPIDISKRCNFYKPDNQINIYLELNLYTYEYVLRVVDSFPLAKDDQPQIFQFALKNVDVKGECIE